MKTNHNHKLEHKILFLGLDSVGKTTIIMKLKDFKVKFYFIKNEEVAEIFPTPFIKTEKIFFENNFVNLIEVSGQVYLKK
jgi:GTPase SAR1 family protein